MSSEERPKDTYDGKWWSSDLATSSDYRSGFNVGFSPEAKDLDIHWAGE